MIFIETTGGIHINAAEIVRSVAVMIQNKPDKRPVQRYRVTLRDGTTHIVDAADFEILRDGNDLVPARDGYFLLLAYPDGEGVMRYPVIAWRIGAVARPVVAGDLWGFADYNHEPGEIAALLLPDGRVTDQNGRFWSDEGAFTAELPKLPRPQGDK